MAYPDDLPTFTNPLASDPRVGHATLHGAVNDALEEVAAFAVTLTRSAVITLTPSNLTDSVALPAGAWLVDIIPDPSTIWDGAATLAIGDGGNATGFLDGLALTTYADGPFTLAELMVQASQGVGPGFLNAGGYLGGNYNITTRRYPAGGTITATVSGTPTTGEALILVLYAVPA